MILVLAGAAHAEPSPDLAEAERAAADLILDCRLRGTACGASDEALAQAFVTVAVAGAVLRGEIDRQAVADAELLAPDAVAAWRDLLPTAADRPDGWVAQRVDGPVPEDDAWTRSPTARPHWRLEEGPPVLDLDVGGIGFFWPPALRLAGEALVSVGPIGVMASARTTQAPTELAPAGQASVSVSVHTTDLSLMAGPRLREQHGAECLPYAGVEGWSGGIGAGWRPLARAGDVEPGLSAVGARVGLRLREPLRWGFVLDFDTSLGLGWAWTGADPLHPRRDLSGAALDPGRIRATARDLVRVEWNPTDRLGLGLVSFTDPDFRPASQQSATFGFALGLTWVSR